MQGIVSLGLVMGFLLGILGIEHHQKRQDILDRCDTSPAECFRAADEAKAREEAAEAAADAAKAQRRDELRAAAWNELDDSDKLLKAETVFGPVFYTLALITLIAGVFTAFKRRASY